MKVPRVAGLYFVIHSLVCRGSSPGMIENFCLFHVVHTRSGIHPSSYRSGTGGKAAGAFKPTTHHPAIAEVKKMWIYTSTPPCAVMA
jgi:hypothetical protein